MENQNLFDLHIDEESARYLKETAKWGSFLAIVAFIMIGFYVLALLFGLIVGSAASGGFEAEYSTANPFAAVMGTGVGVAFFIAYLALFTIPVVYLYRFSTRIKTALDGNDQTTLTNSFGNLKSMFKFYGIFMIVMLGIMALAFVFMLVTLGTAGF
ncbi:DUF5362 family protein [Chitinophaga deserti]|uniref:DUF5362 family protein n=1 Tax=Chitinophaga deserti TaxID=2164099 RepID=UPI000D6BCCC4|nr:DUF5362 family protein [Chitinophaga deserti]